MGDSIIRTLSLQLLAAQLHAKLQNPKTYQTLQIHSWSESAVSICHTKAELDKLELAIPTENGATS
jgi:hypothetical protein